MGAGASVYPKKRYAPLELTLSAFYVFKEWLFLKLWLMRRRPWKLTTRRPPPIIMIDDPRTGGPIGAAYAGGNPFP
mgnify:CR=1 FL=1